MTTRRALPALASAAPMPALLTTGLMVEIIVGVAAVVHPPGHGFGVMAIAAGIAIGTMAIVVRSTLPRIVRMIVMVILATLLLALSASFDPFGIRTVTAALTIVPAGDAAAATDLDDRPVASIVSVHAPAQDTEAQAAAGALARQADADAAAPDAEIEATLATTGPATGPATGPTPGSTPGRMNAPTYELDWSVVRADERLWCGHATVTAPTREAGLATLASRLNETLAQSKGGALRCR